MVGGYTRVLFLTRCKSRGRVLRGFTDRDDDEASVGRLGKRAKHQPMELMRRRRKGVGET